MNKDQISPQEVVLDPSNKNWTTPRSYGVWELPNSAGGKKFRYGNNPIREKELSREFGSVKLIALYLTRGNAIKHTKQLNNG